jgi:hypothetical protein
MAFFFFFFRENGEIIGSVVVSMVKISGGHQAIINQRRKKMKYQRMASSIGWHQYRNEMKMKASWRNNRRWRASKGISQPKAWRRESQLENGKWRRGGGVINITEKVNGGAGVISVMAAKEKPEKRNNISISVAYGLSGSSVRLDNERKAKHGIEGNQYHQSVSVALLIK